MLDIIAKGLAAGGIIALAFLAAVLMISGAVAQVPDLLSIGLGFGILLGILVAVMVIIWVLKELFGKGGGI